MSDRKWWKPSPATEAKIEVAMLGVVIAGGWHTALVITTGLDLVEYRATLSALFDALLRGGSVVAVGTNTSGEVTGPVTVWLVILGTYLALRLGLWLLLRGRRKRQKKTAASKAELSSAKDLRDRIKGPLNAQLAPSLFTLGGRPLSVRREDTATVLGAPRVGKSAFMVAALVADAPGACITTSTRPDILRLTQGIRKQKGHVFVADFDGISGWPNKLKWDLVAGCEDSEVALQRAQAMVNALADQEDKKHMHFLDGCAKIIRALLHAAALKGGNMREVMKWSQNFTDEEPALIIRRQSPTVKLWSSELDLWCREDNPDTIGNTAATLSRVLEPLTREQVLALVCPEKNDADTIDVKAFATGTDTLYCMVNEAAGSNAAPIVTALVESIAQEALKAANRLADGRLTVPLTLALDEAPNVCPLPSVPVLMTAGGGSGLHTWVFAQGYSQIVKRWGEQEGQTIVLDGSAALVIFGGLRDEGFLRQVSALLGDHLVERTSYTESTGTDGKTSASKNQSQQWEPRMRVSQIRKLPEGNVLLLDRELDTVAQVHGWWERPEEKAFKVSRKECWELEGLTGAQITVQEQQAAAAESRPLSTTPAEGDRDDVGVPA